MLLRSSSTPVLGSLLPSFSDSPNNSNHTYYHDTNSAKHHPRTTIPFYQTGPLNLSSSFSCSSSPISPSIAGKGIRRAQSEGNLEGLAFGSCSNTEDSHDSRQLAPKKFTGRPPKSFTLQTIPSFSFYGSRGLLEDEEEFDFSDDDYDDEREDQEKINHEISNRQIMVSTEERVMDRSWDAGVEQERGVVSSHQEVSLAIGLGLGGGGGGGGGNSGRGGEFNSGGGDGRDKDSSEEYYRRMVEENPGNPLFLRNYAQFLYQSTEDLPGAEEYYSRAILADPSDGEIMSQYAQLLWELHHDQDRALSYFERAVQASPEDSHVHAAYANFLWEMEEDEDGCDVPVDFDATRPYSHAGAMTTANA
ncbi:Tetratricopeptide repeat-like superfamily protein putative isoform 2 [Tripterygium wilfordii]|uniref:Tetratricopeptide repeat-like superfamily protein putative isoform 2 n=1 Tax=Tripterygium wilfordii TaxID=458696 RepID=A0A7J7CY19_TRIWF|nr:uncharacterized protein LOC120011288 [Tripterygium wilfordii]KAF5738992.1 Tetratricopeptide repeat-like superfamily protein putative isoform 2 [Tripterygium wilfordii]